MKREVVTREEFVELTARALYERAVERAATHDPARLHREWDESDEQAEFRIDARAVLAVVVPAVLEEAAREVDRCADAQAALLGEDHDVTVVSRGMAYAVRALAERLTGG